MKCTTCEESDVARLSALDSTESPISLWMFRQIVGGLGDTPSQVFIVPVVPTTKYLIHC